MTEKEFKTLLDKFLEGKASEAEENILKKFEEHFVNQDKAAVFKNDFEKNTIKKEIFTPFEKRTKKKKAYRWSIAASLLLLLSFGTTLWFSNKSENNTMEVANFTEPFKKIALADGSTVILKKGSTLKYTNSYKNTRHVVLEGQAFFEVAKNKKKPFIVHTGKLQTKVLGTSFNIAERDSEISVTVATGLVEVSNKENAVKLKPNQRVVYEINSKSFRTIDINHNLFTFWYKNAIKLNNLSIKELSEFITYTYGYKVKFIDEQAKNNRMTIRLKPEEDIQTLIDNINYIDELKLTKTENNMIEVSLK